MFHFSSSVVSVRIFFKVSLNYLGIVECGELSLNEWEAAQLVYK